MPGVAGGPFDDRSTRREAAGTLCVVDDPKRRAVFHRSAGIEKLRLCRRSCGRCRAESFSRTMCGVLPIVPENPRRASRCACMFILAPLQSAMFRADAYRGLLLLRKKCGLEAVTRERDGCLRR